MNWQTVWSGGTSSVFNPMTSQMPSTAVEEVDVTIDLVGGGVEVVPGIQYSANGVDWDSPVELSTGSHTSSQGYSYFLEEACPDGFVGSGSEAPTEKLAVRFGLFAKNTGQASSPKAVRAKIWVRPKRIVSTVLRSTVRSCASGGSTSASSEVFTPLTKPVSPAPFTQLRVSWSTWANTGAARCSIGYQTSNDMVSWSTPALVGGLTARTSNGTTLGEGWSSLSVSDVKYVRFGAMVDNSSDDGTVHACTVSVVVELRG